MIPARQCPPARSAPIHAQLDSFITRLAKGISFRIPASPPLPRTLLRVRQLAAATAEDHRFRLPLQRQNAAALEQTSGAIRRKDGLRQATRGRRKLIVSLRVLARHVFVDHLVGNRDYALSMFSLLHCYYPLLPLLPIITCYQRGNLQISQISSIHCWVGPKGRSPVRVTVSSESSWWYCWHTPLTAPRRDARRRATRMLGRGTLGAATIVRWASGRTNRLGDSEGSE